MDRRLIGCAFSGAILTAPFVALLYDRAAGLAVMILALAATAFVALDTARTAGGATRHRLRLLAVVNAAFAVACLVILIGWIV